MVVMGVVVNVIFNYSVIILKYNNIMPLEKKRGVWHAREYLNWK